MLTFEGEDGLVLRVIDFGQEGLAFTTETGSAPRGITLGLVEIDALGKFVERWKAGIVASCDA